MKIAIVLHTFPVLSETFIVNQICSLLDNNHEVEILAFNKGDVTLLHQNVKDYNLLQKVKYYTKIPTNKLKRFGLFSKKIFSGDVFQVLKTINVFKFGVKALSLEHFYRNQWFLQNNEFDIIHCHFAQLGMFIAQLKSDGFLKNETLFTSFHGVDISPNKIEQYKKNYKILFKYMHACTYNSKYSLKILQQINSTYSGYKFLPVGLNTNFFKPTHQQKMDNIFRILFCGRLVSFKGPDIAVEIIEELINLNYNVHLTVVGNGELNDVLYKKIRDNNLEPYITLKGSLTQDQIIALMNLSDAFLLPGIVDSNGRAENQGLVIQEAQSMALPVVVSDAGGMKYGLIDQVTGYVVQSKNINGFVQKLERLISNENLRTKMGKAARNYVVTTYDNQVLYNQLISYYKNA
ncbi:colanic acid biosynthesis glycosyltransferase WcaL [Urechidicola sp. KH5]